jgi:ribosomal protein S13
MIKLFSKHLPRDFKFGQLLNNFYSIGFKRSEFFCRKLGVPYNSRYSKVPKNSRVFFSKTFVKIFYLNPFYQRSYVENLTFKLRNGSYHGFCIANNLPSRGQRAKTNGKTAFKGLLKPLIAKFA